MIKHFYSKEHHAVLLIDSDGAYIGLDHLGANIIKAWWALRAGGNFRCTGAQIALGRLILGPFGGKSFRNNRTASKPKE
jgi:hypothetical protein